MDTPTADGYDNSASFLIEQQVCRSGFTPVSGSCHYTAVYGPFNQRFYLVSSDLNSVNLEFDSQEVYTQFEYDDDPDYPGTKYRKSYRHVSGDSHDSYTYYLERGLDETTFNTVMTELEEIILHQDGYRIIKPRRAFAAPTIVGSLFSNNVDMSAVDTDAIIGYYVFNDRISQLTVMIGLI